MKKILSITLLSCITYLGSCQNTHENQSAGQVKHTLSVAQFEKKLAEIPDAQLVDVRTADEYAEGHLKMAVNMNVNREDYKEQFAKLNKSKPVFIYCQSGKRSNNAAKIMEGMGFTEIYNMEGGIMEWYDAGKYVESAGTPVNGTTKQR